MWAYPCPGVSPWLLKVKKLKKLERGKQGQVKAKL